MSLFRNLLIEKKKRPYYCEVEYLESTGTQYIDTGYTLNNNSEVEIICNSGDVHQTNLFGYRDASADSRNISITTSTTASYTSDFNNSSYNTYRYTLLTGGINTVKATLSKNERGFYSLDGTLLGRNNTVCTDVFTCGSSAYLMSVAGSPYFTECFKGKVYSCKIGESGVPVRDLIPVLDWNYTPCMYDKVTGQFFYNQGSGTFQYGREIHYVDYLESTGTQYIDTGIKLTNNHSVEIDYQLTQASQSRAGLFGALNMTGSNQGRFGSILSPSNSYLEHGYGAGNDYWQQGLPDTNRHILYQKKNETYFDGTLVHTFNTATFSLVINAYLGNFVYTNYTPAKAKYYSSKWWDGTTLVRDYKPAIDENGVGFMFDRVTHTCFLNAGSGAFQYSNRELDYIESSGTQYIDTGYAFQDNFSWEVDFEGISDGTTLFGGRTSSTRTALLYQRNYGGIDKTTCPIAGYNGQETPFQLDDLRIGRHIIKMSVASNKGSVWVDGTQVYNNESFTGSYISGTSQAIFADKFGANDFREQTSSKVYAVRMWQGTTMVRNLIPTIRNGVMGLFDKVNNVFYTNAGTGTFTGKVKESRWF